jgi:hypothetical protein
MTDRNDFDEDPQLRVLLGQADPARSLAPADPQGLARLLARIEEDTMTTDTETPDVTTADARARRRGSRTWLAAAAAVAVIAGGGFAVASSLGGDEPTAPQVADRPEPDPDPAADPVVVTLQGPTLGARCAAPTPELLAQFDTAFAGTVTAIDGDVVTLAPTETFAGGSADEVEIVGGMDGRALGGVVDFQVGETYYVSATGGQVSACGFSGPTSDAQLTQLYDVAFR